MKQHEYIADYGHCCCACKHYNLTNGYCLKTKDYHHSYEFSYGDGVCSKWKIADDLKQTLSKKRQTLPKKPKIEKVNLLELEPENPRPTPKEMEDFFNDA